MQPITRYLNGEIRAYHIPPFSGSGSTLEPAATYPVDPRSTDNSRWLIHAVTPSLDRAAYLNRDSVMCINQTGHLVWRYYLEPLYAYDSVASGQCAFSRDGSYLWVYRPDAMNDRGPDLLVVLDPDSGDEIARVELDSVGQGATFAVHPDGRTLLLDVGEGQDGVKVYRAVLSHKDKNIDLHAYEWDDRCLVDMAPDHQTFMTFDHGGRDVAFHAFPSGDIVLRLAVGDFGYEDDEACVHYMGGFLDSQTAVVTVKGETDDEEWLHYHTVDVRTGEHLGRIDAHSRDEEAGDFQPLGDGTWVVADADGNPARHRLLTTF
ncbi:uncharacterized protein APUU_51511S [Aspergillus puulaauensis]|uniref:Uncharacterized protein n=1 Tax=Aspergillus puulaauensis TaxID=1220207 RepID=A0A7R8ARN2_9EURO|nr:uncharacterized protein APUU_51511S [Aspergillus puulaauensis]BCS26800.1 hypothetical protein APUU_51511S [Aspergillus puulaauensis]